MTQLEKEKRYLKEQFTKEQERYEIITTCLVVNSMRQQVADIFQMDSPAPIPGAAGSGKSYC